MRAENGIAYLEGDLTLAEAVSVMKEGEHLLAEGVTVFDLAGLDKVDSSALSLFMNWRRTAQASNQSISFKNTPQSLLGLANLYGVTELVDLA